MRSPAVLVLGGHGYIGSALVAHLESAGLIVQSVDLDRRGNPGAIAGEKKAYQDLAKDELEQFESVVLLAGHSSVADCDRWPANAFANNVSGFVELVHKLKDQKLIFASSISVYVNTDDRLAAEGEPLPEAVCLYDHHKQLIERYAALAYPHYYALRFGTVCGPSPNLRTDLLLNNMVRSALSDGYLQVANPHVHRPILGISDLCRAIEVLISDRLPPGRYNLASDNVQVGELAASLARHFDVPCIEVERPTKYDIQVSAEKFRRASGMEFRDTITSLTDSLEKAFTTSLDTARLCNVS